MPITAIKPKDGYEIRGHRIRLYVDAESEAQLLEIRESLRRAWNWLIGQQETAIEASRAYVARENLVGPRPTRPDYNGMTPDESSAAKSDYSESCLEWSKAASKSAKDQLGKAAYAYTIKQWCEHLGVRHDYQLLNRVLEWMDRAPLPSGLLQALTKDFYSKAKRRKTRKRRQDHVPIRTRTGTCFVLGEFGARGKNPAYYDCQVRIAGLKLRGRIKGSGLDPSWRVLEGVALSKEADGWWASIKVERPRRAVPVATPGASIGIDVGLRAMAAFSDGEKIANPRDRVYADRIAVLQASGADANQIARIQQRQARNVRHIIHSKIVPRVERYEVIAIESLPSKIGQRGSSMTSSMRTIRTHLVARFGDRVREVPPQYTSQECSQCGTRDKEAWAYGDNPTCSCRACGYREDRDVNAARNILRRAVESAGN